MPKSSKFFLELLVILGVVAMVIVGFAIIQATRGTISDDRTVGQPVATPSQIIAITPTGHPPSAAVTVSTPPSATVPVPPEAIIQTAEQAVEKGLDVARGLGADNPRLVKVELMTLGEAMQSTKSEPDEVVEVDELGWDARSAAWRVQFDNDEFFTESCPPPDDATPGGQEGHTCPTHSTAIFIFRATDGLPITVALGYPVPQ